MNYTEQLATLLAEGSAELYRSGQYPDLDYARECVAESILALLSERLPRGTDAYSPQKNKPPLCERICPSCTD